MPFVAVVVPVPLTRSATTTSTCMAATTPLDPTPSPEAVWPASCPSTPSPPAALVDADLAALGV